MRWRPTPLTTVVVTLAFALLGNVATGTVEVSSGAGKAVVWLAVGFLALASLILEIGRARAGPVPAPAHLDVIADGLAQSVRMRLRREEEHRKVTDPIPLPLRWKPADDSLIDHWANICGAALGRIAEPVALAGELDEISVVYRRIPSGRLVVLGAAGSGKTVLAARLAAELVALREPGGPVPYPVSIASWNPAESLRDWLTGQLLRDHPGTAAAYPGYPNLAAALLGGDHILPVLDGFDELGSGLHEAALAALNTAAALPLVLTSRPEEYAAAVREADVLTAAAGIHLDDLTLEDIARYLPRTNRRPAAAGWQPVMERLHSDEEGEATALARALSTPLMVYLARTIYSDRPTHDPVGLLDTGRFPTPQALEEHLFAAYLPAVYPDGPAADRARRWLSYLARHLDALGRPDLAWWQLRDTVPRAVRVLVLGLAAGLVVGIVFWPLLGCIAVLLGFVVGLAFGPMVGLPATGPRPARARFDVRGQLRPFVDGVASGLTAGLVLGVALGLVDGFEVGVGVGLVAGVVIGLAVWLTNALESPVDVTVSAGISESLVRDRRNSVWQGSVVGAAIGTVTGVATGVAVGGGGAGWVDNLFLVVFIAVPIGILVGIPAGLVGAWGQWLVLVRLWLPLTGHLPWRLNAFLADAYQRGVLRQAGSVYQFRHDHLKSHLAAQPELGRSSPSAGAACRQAPHVGHAHDSRHPEPGRT